MDYIRRDDGVLVFSSLTFLLWFLPVTAGLYFALPGIRWKNTVLLAASVLFYAWGEPLWVFVLMGLTLLVWLCSAGVAKWQNKWLRRAALTLGVISPMAVLAWVKYGGFLFNPVLELVGVGLPEVAMPLGISFFTFQIVTYVVDVYRQRELYQKNPLDLMLYISCFPQLVAGPIVRYQDVAEQMTQRTTTMDDFAAGMKRFACGLGKKVILANVCGKAVEAVIGNQAMYGMSVLGGWYMAVLYSLQIYFDFSGYSDMAIGMGRIFGFRYSENFNYPYMSKSIAEFWRRWHISLGTFFREYVYIPMGGNRVSRIRQLWNLLVVWGLTGLWHGASLNFVLWGLYYFALIALERFVFRPVLDRLPALVRGIGTYALVLVGWVIFYFTDTAELVVYLKSLVGVGAPIARPELWMVVCQYSYFPLVALAAAFPMWQGLRQDVLERLGGVYTLWLCLVFALSVLMIVGQSYNPFIYFRF